MWMFAAILIKCWYYLGRKADVIYSFRSWRETFKNHSLTLSVFVHVRRPYTGERYLYILGSCIRAYVITLGSCVCVYVLTVYTARNITDVFIHTISDINWLIVK
jgi:hypothetical protein